MKITITLIKYVPQVYLNWVRHSTHGWSMENVMLDFSGGLLSIVQIFIDGANSGSWDVFSGGGSFNVAKFVLGFTSMFFDVIFMTQHWILFHKKPELYSDALMLKPIEPE
jgi:cystinosin